MVEGKGEGIIVVTSDRMVKDRVEGFGSVCISSEFFAKKCEETAYRDLKGGGDDFEIYREKPKKGPSRRKSKKDRKRDRVIPKL